VLVILGDGAAARSRDILDGIRMHAQRQTIELLTAT
jgi:hypothetical protein